MFSHVTKWGNSLGVRIPRVLAEQTGIAAGEPIELTIEDGRIIIQKKTYRLDELLKQVTPENLHHEINSGPAKGKEVW